jgi:signal transduction histidine kinase
MRIVGLLLLVLVLTPASARAQTPEAPQEAPPAVEQAAEVATAPEGSIAPASESAETPAEEASAPAEIAASVLAPVAVAEKAPEAAAPPIQIAPPVRSVAAEEGPPAKANIPPPVAARQVPAKPQGQTAPPPVVRVQAPVAAPAKPKTEPKTAAPTQTPAKPDAAAQPATSEDVNPYETTIKAAKERMMADPVSAYQLAMEAEKLANASDTARKATALWLVGEALNRQNRPAEAIPVLDRGLELVKADGQKSKLVGDLMMARAASARSQGDYALAMANYKSAHDVFADMGEDRSRALSLQQVGSIYTDARDYKKALEYYQRAGEAYAGDPAVDLSRLNNIAHAHRLLGQYDEAEAGFRDALKISETMKSPMLQARILTNMASVQMMAGRSDEALATARRGLALSSPDGQTGSGWEPYLWGVEAQVALAKGDLATASTLIARTFQGQDIKKTSMPFRDFHETAYTIYSKLDQPALALNHLSAFKRLDDEARDVSAAANNALVGAQFDFASQELRLANLRTETLEKEVALQKSRARQRLIVLGGLAGLGLVMLIGGTGHYLSMRRSRNEVRTANVKLSDSNKALEKALKAKSEFLATTSHEIRTPLNGILGMTQILMQQRDLNASARERVELVHASGMTMKAIVDDILDMSKIQTGAVTIEPVTFDLRATLSEVAQTWSDSAHEKGVDLSWDLDQCPRMTVGDERRIRQVVFNLLSNAVKFTDAGSVKLSVGVEPGAESHYWVRVSDTGCGIPADQMDAIFEAFHQADGGRTRKHAGTGLGLSICRSLARAMNGDVTAESELDKGSTFTLRLPLVEPAAGTAGPVAGTGERKLLLVDDNMLRISILEAMLEEPERPVTTAGSLKDAQGVISAGGVEAVLVFADVLGDNAGAVVEAMMELAEAAGETPIVVQIGDIAGLEAPMLRIAGARDVLSGPFDAMKTVAALQGATETANGELTNPGAGANAA